MEKQIQHLNQLIAAARQQGLLTYVIKYQAMKAEVMKRLDNMERRHAA